MDYTYLIPVKKTVLATRASSMPTKPEIDRKLIVSLMGILMENCGFDEEFTHILGQGPSQELTPSRYCAM